MKTKSDAPKKEDLPLAGAAIADLPFASCAMNFFEEILPMAFVAEGDLEAYSPRKRLTKFF